MSTKRIPLMRAWKQQLFHQARVLVTGHTLHLHHSTIEHQQYRYHNAHTAKDRTTEIAINIFSNRLLLLLMYQVKHTSLTIMNSSNFLYEFIFLFISGLLGNLSPHIWFSTVTRSDKTQLEVVIPIYKPEISSLQHIFEEGILNVLMYQSSQHRQAATLMPSGS